MYNEKRAHYDAIMPRRRVEVCKKRRKGESLFHSMMNRSDGPTFIETFQPRPRGSHSKVSS